MIENKAVFIKAVRLGLKVFTDWASLPLGPNKLCVTIT